MQTLKQAQNYIGQLSSGAAYLYYLNENNTHCVVLFIKYCKYNLNIILLQ